jgi:uncharacterized membrane protein YbhN (UPF0104 family)
MLTRKQLNWAVRWLVSGGLLAWIFTRPEIGQLGAVLRDADWRWLAAGFWCAGLALALGAWRWQACLHALGIEVGLGQLCKITLGAAAAGCVSFGALGTDVAKVVLLGRGVGGRHGEIVSSLALDHASALPCVVGIVAAAMIAHGVVPVVNLAGVWWVLGGLGLGVIGAVVIRWKFKRLHTWAVRIWTNRETWRGLLIAGWRSVPVWLAYGGIFYCAARAVGVVVPVVGFAGVIAIADGVASLPVTIAGLGLREQAFRVLLDRWYAVPGAAAVAMSLTGFSLNLAWAAIGALGIAKGSLTSPQPTNS